MAVRARFRLTVALTDPMMKYLERQAKVFGSKSGYVRHLIMMDMQRENTAQAIRMVERERVVEMTLAARPSPPRADGTAELRAELLRELKAKLAERART